MSETYTPAGTVGQSLQRATAGEAATGTHGQEFMRDDMTKIADKIRRLNDLGYPTFPAAFSDQADVNTLDDYEEGTFVPGLTFGGAAVGMTIGTQSGRYTKIGNRVFFSIYIALTAKGSSVGTAVITNLPFSANASSGNNQAQSTRMSSLAASIVAPIQAYISPGTAVNLEKIAAGNAVLLADTDFTNTSGIMVSGHYDT